MTNLFRKILKLIYPEIGWLSNPLYDFTQLRSWESDVKKGKHVKIDPVVHLNNVEIGDYSYISCNGLLSFTKIGKFCSIGPNLLCGWGIHPTNGLSTSPMFYSTKMQNGVSLSKEDKIQEHLPITIGNDVFIGANVTILDGVTIGDGAVIGAGAVVSKDIPPYAIAVGSPIRINRYRYSEQQVAAMMRIHWWDNDNVRLQDVSDMFFDIDAFIAKYDPYIIHHT